LVVKYNLKIGVIVSQVISVLKTLGAAALGSVIWIETHSWWKTALVSVTCVLMAFGKKVWTELEPKWVKYAANSADKLLTALFIGYGYKKTYAKYIYYKHRTFDVKGFSTQGKFALELESVYVDLMVDPAVPGEVSQDPIRKSMMGEHNAKGDIFAWLQPEPGHHFNFAIIGSPGSGKTTLLKHLALVTAAKKKFSDLTSILLFLRDHANAIESNPKISLVEIIESSLKDLPPPVDWFERRLQKGKCLVMLDGLDEVANSELRCKVVTWVEDQVGLLGANLFVVTSRPNGYRTNPLSGFTVLRLLPFTHDQVKSFVQNWYLANEVAAYQKDDPGVRMQAAEGAEDLLKRLDRVPTLQELAVNPLLLTLIATVHRYRSQLPGRRVELFAEICDVFLGRRQQARGLELALAPAQKIRVLRVLAYYMMCNRIREIPKDQAVQTITPSLQLVTPGGDPELFLQMVEDSSGLLIQRENGIYGFAHLTFQEYLSSIHIKEEKLVAELVKKVDQTWWHETARLYAAQADPSPIVEKCLISERPKVEELLLAADCDAEALELRSDLRQRLLRITDQAIDDEESERRRLAAEHKLTRRLREMVRVGDNWYLDTSPLSSAEYQLFVNERRSHSEFRQPDHWDSYDFTRGTALLPIVGIRKSDAEAFCRWVTERTGGDWVYSLPEELAADLSKKWHDLVLFSRNIPPIGTWLASSVIVERIKKDSLLLTEEVTHRSSGRLILFAFCAVILETIDVEIIADLNLAQALANAFNRNRDEVQQRIDRNVIVKISKRICTELSDHKESVLKMAHTLHTKFSPHKELLALKFQATRSFEDRVESAPEKDVVLEFAKSLDLDRARSRDQILASAQSLVGGRYYTWTQSIASDCGLSSECMVALHDITSSLSLGGAPLFSGEQDRLAEYRFKALSGVLLLCSVALNRLCLIEAYAEDDLAPPERLWLGKARRNSAELSKTAGFA
jgi:energy-coupling factor transporter ATP-binding protein EcfA2